jgi:N6-adenosine-specific RNA methylase IME4
MTPYHLYKTILIDPPWYEPGGGRYKRGADKHYPLLKTYDILPTILQSGMFWPDWTAHLYLWATNNHLHDAMGIVERLGFKYVTCLTWAKTRRFGLGHYFRGQTEQLLFGVTGNKPLEMMQEHRREHGHGNSFSTLIEAQRGGHSVKPEQAYQLIEASSPPPRLEMFARRPREGWAVWGDEV